MNSLSMGLTVRTVFFIGEIVTVPDAVTASVLMVTLTVATRALDVRVRAACQPM